MLKLRTLALATALAVSGLSLALPAQAQPAQTLGNFSMVLPNGNPAVAKQIFPDATGTDASRNPRRHWRVCNVNASGGPTGWFSWFGAPTVNGAGSYPLVAGRCEEFGAPGFVPQTPLYGVSDGTGTVALTATVY